MEDQIKLDTSKGNDFIVDDQETIWVSNGTVMLEIAFKGNTVSCCGYEQEGKEYETLEDLSIECQPGFNYVHWHKE